MTHLSRTTTKLRSAAPNPAVETIPADPIRRGQTVAVVRGLAFTAVVWLLGPGHPSWAINEPPLIGQPPSSTAPQTFEKREQLFDDHHGLRLALKERGVDLDVTYINYYQNVVLGRTTYGRDDDYGRIRFTLDADLNRLAGLPGLTFHFSAVNQNGGNIGTNVGSYSNPDNLTSSQSTRVDTYWLQQKFFDGALVLRFGQLAQQDDYAVQEYASSFVMEPLGYALGNLFDNVTASADPESKPGFEVRVYPYGGFYVKVLVAAGDQNPFGEHDHHGLGFSLDGHGVVASEIGYRREEISRAAALASKSSPAADDGEGGKAVAAAVESDGIKTLREGDLPAVYKLGAYVSRNDYLTVFASGAAARTFDYQAGDVGYVPLSMPHYVQNTGTETLRFLEAFASDHYADVSLNQWLALSPPELVQQTLQVAEGVVRGLKKVKQAIVKS